MGIGAFTEVCGIGPRVDDGEWHHVVVSYQADSGETRLFLDASQVTLEQNPLGIGEKLTDTQVAVGSLLNEATGSWQEFWTGGLSRISIYARVLDTATIQDHFQAIDAQAG